MFGYAPVVSAADDASAELQEVQVTGTRIKRNSDFDTANPTTVVDAGLFQEPGYRERRRRGEVTAVERLELLSDHHR